MTSERIGNGIEFCCDVCGEIRSPGKLYARMAKAAAKAIGRDYRLTHRANS